MAKYHKNACHFLQNKIMSGFLVEIVSMSVFAGSLPCGLQVSAMRSC